jgi:hypothetical protein
VSVINSIDKLQKSVNMYMTPSTLVVSDHLLRKLEKEAEACMRYQCNNNTLVSKLSFINDMEVTVDNLFEKNEIMFCDKKGNFSKFFIIENIDRITKLPKRKGRYIRCNSIST